MRGIGAGTLCALGLALLAVAAAQPVSAASHAPILIEGDTGFTAANGVTGGTGTSGDPFLVANWEIVLSGGNGIDIRNTSAYFRLENVTVSGGQQFEIALYLFVVSHFEVRNFSSHGNWMGISGYAVNNGTIDHSSFSGSVNPAVALDQAAFVAITNCSFQDNVYNDLLVDSFVNSVTISHNYFGGIPSSSQQSYGVFLRESESAPTIAVPFVAHIDHNSFSNSTAYVAARQTSITNNSFGNSMAYYALGLGNNPDIEVRANTFVGASIRVGLRSANEQGPLPVETLRNYVITADNLVNGLPFLFYTLCDGITVQDKLAASLLVAGCSDIVIANVTASNTSSGILLIAVHNATVVDCEVSGSQNGIEVSGFSTNVRIVANWLHGNQDGVFVGDSSSILISKNNVSNNTYAGVATMFVTDLTVTENMMADNGQFGIAMGSTDRAAAYHNNFYRNPAQAYGNWSTADIRFDDGYPSGGNFWSDYAGADRCRGSAQDDCTAGDGIGDTPRDVPDTKQDGYPLMRPYAVATSLVVASLSATPAVGNLSTSFVFDARASISLADTSPTLEFRFDFDSDGAWDRDWASQALASKSYSALGEYTCRVEVRDGPGRTDSATIGVIVINGTLPTSPGSGEPYVSADLVPAVASSGAPIEVRLVVLNLQPSSTVVLYYRGPGEAQFQWVGMSLDSSGAYRASIPAQTTSGALEYYAQVEESGGTVHRVPASGSWRIEVVPRPGGQAPPWALWLAAGAVVGVVGLSATEVGRYRVILALVGRLYPRLKKESLLTHFVRGRLYQVISQDPGVHFSELRRLADVSNGTATYHLRVLQKNGFIRAEGDGMLVRFYPTGQKFEDSTYGLEESEEAVLHAVRENPGIEQESLATRLNQHPATIKRAVDRLEKLGYLQPQGAGPLAKLVARQPPPE